MITVQLRPEAEADLEDIADYTTARWGLSQAQAYLVALRADILSLGQFARRYPVHEASGLGLRRMGSGHHLVFYLVGETLIEVVRVLHERMDVEDQLD